MAGKVGEFNQYGPLLQLQAQRVAEQQPQYRELMAPLTDARYTPEDLELADIFRQALAQSQFARDPSLKNQAEEMVNLFDRATAGQSPERPVSTDQVLAVAQEMQRRMDLISADGVMTADEYQQVKALHEVLPDGIKAWAPIEEFASGATATSSLGLSGGVGDAIRKQVDEKPADWAAHVRELEEMSGGMSSSALEQKAGKELPGPQYVPPSADALDRGRQLWGKHFHTPLGDHSVSRERYNGSGALGAAFGRSLEAACEQDPAFKSRLEKLLGGRVIPDHRSDGRITVHRFQPSSSQVPLSDQTAKNPALSSLLSNLARMEGNQKSLMDAFANPDFNRLGFPVRSALRDPFMGSVASELGLAPPLSFEDILFLLMLKYAKDKEEQILNKTQEMLRDGSKADGYNPTNADQSDTNKQAVVQKMMNDLQKVYQLLTNVIKSLHDMLMAEVRNIR